MLFALENGTTVDIILPETVVYIDLTCNKGIITLRVPGYLSLRNICSVGSEFGVPMQAISQAVNISSDEIFCAVGPFSSLDESKSVFYYNIGSLYPPLDALEDFADVVLSRSVYFFLGRRHPQRPAVPLPLLLPLRADLRRLHPHLGSALAAPLPAGSPPPRLHHRRGLHAARRSVRQRLEAPRARSANAESVRVSPGFQKSPRNHNHPHPIAQHSAHPSVGPPFPRFAGRVVPRGAGSAVPAVFAVAAGPRGGEAGSAGFFGRKGGFSGAQVLTPIVAWDVLPRLSSEVALREGRFSKERIERKANGFSRTASRTSPTASVWVWTRRRGK